MLVHLTHRFPIGCFNKAKNTAFIFIDPVGHGLAAVLVLYLHIEDVRIRHLLGSHARSDMEIHENRHRRLFEYQLKILI
jgi:hypothetical protein